MKQLFNAYQRCYAKGIGTLQFINRFTRNIFCLTVVLSALLFTGCKKQEMNGPVTHHLDNKIMNTDEEFRHSYDGLGWRTMWELLQARAASAKYRNIKKAIKDGYADISVVVPNMGYHYMRSAIVDAKFEVTKPEILVYNKMENGSFELVAVEYAVPIDLTPNAAPAGFTGSEDVWDRNTGFGLWLLHAWVWHHNPDGVFNPTNPLVHLH